MTIIDPPKEAARRGGEESPAAGIERELDVDFDDEFDDEFEEALRRQLLRDGTIADD
jgi:hypothetical protein